MSSEIVSVRSGSGSISKSNEDIRSLQLLNLRRAGNVPAVKVDLIGENHWVTNFMSPEKGQKHVTQSHPTPDSVKSLIEEMKDPSVLFIRGCNQLFLPSTPDFPFDKFKILTSLEISSVSYLIALPENTISEMTQLQSLELSHLPIQHLEDDFFEKLVNLRSLVLKGCTHLFSLPDVYPLYKLQCLDLSFLSFPKFSKDYVFSEMRELRWLILRGCSRLIFLPSLIFAEKLEVLDLSHCTSLQYSENGFLIFPSLKMVDFSFVGLNDISALVEYYKVSDNLTHMFLSGKNVTSLDKFCASRNLQVLDLSGVPDLNEADWLEAKTNLIALDLSRTRIESIDFLSNLIHLGNLILRECTELVRLPAMKSLINLEVLDISDCYKLIDLPEDLSNLANLKELNLSACLELKELREGLFDQMTCLEKLDLSQNDFNHLPSFSNLINLQILNISEIHVQKLPDMSALVNLRELLFANAEFLQVLPDVQAHVHLETFDLSLGDNFHDNNLQIDAQSGQFLSVPSRLRRLVLANRPGVVKLFPQASLEKLEYLDLRGTNEIDCIGLVLSEMEKNQEVVGWDDNINHPIHVQRKNSSTCDEIHLVSTFISKSSAFDRFKYEFRELEDLISNIQDKFQSRLAHKVFPTIHTPNGSKGKIQYQLYKRHFGRIHEDLNYILKYLNCLESSHNCKISENLLLKLFDAATYLSSVDSPFDYTKLNELFRIIANLKLLVPPPRQDELKEVMVVNEEDHYETTYAPGSLRNIKNSYDTLTKLERDCLLCFVVFPPSGDIHERSRILKRFRIKKTTLIQWWICEGLIDLQHDENPNSIPNQVPQHASTTNGAEKLNTAEEIGQQILKVLVERKLIWPVIINQYWESASYCIRPLVHSFVTQKAMEEGFFNFHDQNHKLTPYLKGSQRACLLKSDGNLPSSCQLWSNYGNSFEKKLEHFQTTRTLFNINEKMIYITTEWFSKMTNLRVLHLGNSDFEIDHIEVVNLRFMEEFKKMKHLRLLSIKGFSAIEKLPDSVCKLTNLKVLNLRDCGYLEELPGGIGSLKNLTHLDITNCHTLSMLPKEVSLLSKLEVLKGFLISYQMGGRQNRKACTLRELLKLKSLRKLNLVVNANIFPHSEDLRVFREMMNLCNLKIAWEKSYDKDHEQHPDEALATNSRWKQLKCWEQQTRKNNEAEEKSRSHHFDSLKKLVLFCFPLDTIPSWLRPSELRNLEKLYIEGGNLKTLLGDSSQNTWSVKTLRVMNLSHFEMDWDVLLETFPNMKLFWHYKTKPIQGFPLSSSYNRVWKLPEFPSFCP